MTSNTATMTGSLAGPSIWSRMMAGQTGPVCVVLIALFVLWYVGAVFMNAPTQIDKYNRADQTWTTSQLIEDTLAQERPILPAPHQVAQEMYKTIFATKITSKRSLVYHSWVTLSSTLLGFGIGTILGIVLAVGIVHVMTLEKSLMPWVISSQTIPILAIAPMIIVVLGAIGIKGVVPKAVISTYLCFFPVTISMVKGLRSPQVIQLDLMRTYNASKWQTFWQLRLPSAMPYLFASLKVAIAISLVGAIVGELPTGAQAGLGARLLAGSYYGQTIQIWSALLTAAFVAAMMVVIVGWFERRVLARMGVKS
ncbi:MULTISPECIES: ABC transporter permease [Thalassospira]|nr:MULTISPECIES: ABC transporter permease [Thalassospira]KZB66046.1 ABC transporter permease [Thalassospira sp. MCCC 1A02491]MCC4238644.1 ABC transporter permease [Thalassospira povalilytica]MEE3044970.1 ABC transporter permease [Pseudomonadota bacterium]RCK19539.1 ABC transporter permease [Thalassospira profundimaris]